LVGASVEEANAATGHGDVKVVLAEVAAGVRRLHDHFLAGDGAGCESQSRRHHASALKSLRPEEWQSILIARAAPAIFRPARQLCGGESIRKTVVYGPGALVAAHEGLAAAVIARALGRHVGQRVVALVAAADGLVDGRLARPSAGSLAAVPVARRAACSLRGGEGGEGEEGEVCEGVHCADHFSFFDYAYACDWTVSLNVHSLQSKWCEKRLR